MAIRIGQGSYFKGGVNTGVTFKSVGAKDTKSKSGKLVERPMLTFENQGGGSIEMIILPPLVQEGRGKGALWSFQDTCNAIVDMYTQVTRNACKDKVEWSQKCLGFEERINECLLDFDDAYYEASLQDQQNELEAFYYCVMDEAFGEREDNIATYEGVTGSLVCGYQKSSTTEKFYTNVVAFDRMGFVKRDQDGEFVLGSKENYLKTPASPFFTGSIDVEDIYSTAYNKYGIILERPVGSGSESKEQKPESPDTEAEAPEEKADPTSEGKPKRRW